MRKKKIVITIPDLCTGGAEKMVVELASNLNKEEFEVYVLVIRKPLNNELERSISSNVNIIYLNKDYGFNPLTLWQCYKKLLLIKPDIIHTHIQSFTYVVPYIMCHGVKMIHTIHNIPEEEAKGLRRKLLKFLFKYKKAVPVGISDKITYMTKKLYRIEIVETVYNPVDNKVFYPSKNHDIHRECRFISVGRMVDQKNFKLLVAAFSEYLNENQNATLTILGDGPLRSDIENQVNQLKCANSILLLGNKSNVADYLRQSDIFILTSKFEGLPMTVLEAMATGLPIICTDVGGVSDVVEENGILIHKHNTDEVISAIRTLVNDKTKRSQMGEKSKELSYKYFIANVANEYEKLYMKYSR